MSKVYRLKTLRDVFMQVPKDRLAVCMAEIANGMLHAHEVLAATGEPLEWQEICEWTDDGKVETTIEIQDRPTGRAPS